jgi:hypothetical protein
MQPLAAEIGADLPPQLPHPPLDGAAAKQNSQMLGFMRRFHNRSPEFALTAIL